MFDPTKKDLKDILEAADEGKLQLPDFQRDYVWGDEDVKSLIASVAKGFPVGALLTLETGGEVRFKPRVLQGAPASPRSPDVLLLDGQQRITSLYQALYASAPVRTRTPKGVEVERFYYMDVAKALALGSDIEDAIIGVPASRKVMRNFGKEVDLDLSTPDHEYAAGMFPLNKSFESRDWFYGWRDYRKAKGDDPDVLERPFIRSILERIERYKMPVIQLDSDNSREAICLVFEKVNVGGKKLDAFELVTAIYAANEYDLREDWNGAAPAHRGGRHARMVGSEAPRNVLTKVASTEFLQACALLHTREHRLQEETVGKVGNELPQISCKREAVLALPLEQYKRFAPAVEQGFIEAAAFLNEQKIIWQKDVPYPPQIVALAAAFAVLGRDRQGAAARQKLSQWFWCVTLGELYGSSTETRMARDVHDIAAWISADGAPPRSVSEALFQVKRLQSLRSRLAAAYKGIHALMMREGCRDFISGKPTDIMTFFQDKIDIHHIFPEAWCKKAGIPPAVYNSVVNKTPLSKRSNILISGDAPSVYLARIEKTEGLTPQQLDDILRSHLIEPELLRANDFHGFMAARTVALTRLIGDAMGKAPVAQESDNEPEQDVSESDNDTDEDAQ